MLEFVSSVVFCEFMCSVFLQAAIHDFELRQTHTLTGMLKKHLLQLSCFCCVVVTCLCDDTHIFNNHNVYL